MEQKQRIVVGISGASGSLYAVKLLQVLQTLPEVETHLVISSSAKQTLRLETEYPLDALYTLADEVYDEYNMAASIASGSFVTAGMIVLPCSIKTLSGIANSYSDNLLLRAADVMLKERRPLILCVRETPLHLGHLRLMTTAAELGAIIMPPSPALYHKPQTLEQMIEHTVGRILSQLNLQTCLYQPWQTPSFTF